MKLTTDWRNYCAACQCIHVPTVDCDGKPVDWQQRRARAVAWLHRKDERIQIHVAMPDVIVRRGPYDYKD